MGSRVGRPPGSKGGGGGDSWPWAWACWAYRQGNAGFLGPKARPGVVLRTFGGGCSIDSLAPSSRDRKSTRLNSSHSQISYAVFCLKKKKETAEGHDRSIT